MGEKYCGLRLNLSLKGGESSILQSISLNLMQSGAMVTQPSLESPSINGVQTSIERGKEPLASYNRLDLNQPIITSEGDNLVVLPSDSVALHDCRNINENDEGSNQAKKKMRFSVEQAALLEDIFQEHNIPDQKQKSDLAEVLNVTPRQVGVWFQNRRAKLRMKKTEIDAERLKIYYDKLKEENEILKKELDDTRAQNISYHTNINPTPASFAVSPSCDNVRISPSLSSISTLPSLSLHNGGIKQKNQEQDVGTTSTSKRS